MPGCTASRGLHTAIALDGAETVPLLLCCADTRCVSPLLQGCNARPSSAAGGGDDSFEVCCLHSVCLSWQQQQWPQRVFKEEGVGVSTWPAHQGLAQVYALAALPVTAHAADVHHLLAAHIPHPSMLSTVCVCVCLPLQEKLPQPPKLRGGGTLVTTERGGGVGELFSSMQVPLCCSLEYRSPCTSCAVCMLGFLQTC